VAVAHACSADAAVANCRWSQTSFSAAEQSVLPCPLLLLCSQGGREGGREGYCSHS
jgi:hypothetical protein